MEREFGSAAPVEREPDTQVRASGEQPDLLRLQRAAIEAALRWVAADPAASSLDTGAADVAVDLEASSDLSRALDQRDASVFRRTTALVANEASSRDAQEAVLMAEFEVASPESSHTSGRPASAEAARATVTAPVEDVVEVSIGAIHVHVDGSPERPQRAKVTPRRGSESAGRSSGSGLERRYLRAI